MGEEYKPLDDVVKAELEHIVSDSESKLLEKLHSHMDDEHTRRKTSGMRSRIDTALNSPLEEISNGQNLDFGKDGLGVDLSGVDHRGHPYSTIQVGGTAGAVITPYTLGQLEEIIAFCHSAKLIYGVRGLGSNSVFANLDVLINTHGMSTVLDRNPENGQYKFEAGMPLGRIWGNEPVFYDVDTLGKVPLKHLLAGLSVSDVSKRTGYYRGQLDVIFSPQKVDGFIDQLMTRYINNQSLAGFCYLNSLEGAESLADIPGNIGGATYVNAAGREDQGVGNIFKAADIVLRNGKFVEKPRIVMESKYLGFSRQEVEKIKFPYRISSFSQEPEFEGSAIYSVTLNLSHISDNRIIAERMFDDYIHRRLRHPSESISPNVGSVFIKKYGKDEPTGDVLIREAGLAGNVSERGNFHISELYPLFIVNRTPNEDSNPESRMQKVNEFLAFLGHIYDTVIERTGRKLRQEVRVVPNSYSPNYGGEINGNSKP
jgi:UDP-N-acetylenolpyruvoylglucosamine reductase